MQIIIFLLFFDILQHYLEQSFSYIAHKYLEHPTYSLLRIALMGTFAKHIGRKPLEDGNPKFMVASYSDCILLSYFEIRENKLEP